MAGASEGGWRADVLDAATLWTVRLGGVLASVTFVTALLRAPGRLLQPSHVVMLGAFTGLVALRYSKRASYHQRAFAFCGLNLLVGAGALHGIGVHPGPTLVTAFVVIAARLFLGSRAMLGSLVLSTAAVVSAGRLQPASVAWVDAAQFGGLAWLRFGFGYAMPTACLAMLVAHVVAQIERSLRDTAEALQRSLVAEDERQRSQETLAKVERALVRSQKLEAVGRLAAGVGHDFNNTLQVMLSWASILKDEQDPGMLEEGLDAIERAALQGRELTQRLLEFGRRDVRSSVRVSPVSLVRDSAGSLRRLLPEDINIELDLDEGVGDLSLDPHQLAHVLLNLGANARDAMPSGGVLRIVVASATTSELPEEMAALLAAPELVRITVQDSGVGMSAETLAHVFEPFYTTKGERGTGLGLATSYALVQRNGGLIRIESEVGKGTTVHVYFPVTDAPAEAPVVAARVSRRVGRGVVMVAEDDSDVRRTMVRALQAAGYDVLESPDALSAMELLVQRGTQVDVLCTDGIMPGGGTRQLIEYYLGCRPGGQVIVCSGYVQEELLRRDLDAGSHAFLPKPFQMSELVERIGSLIERDPSFPASARGQA